MSSQTKLRVDPLDHLIATVDSVLDADEARRTEDSRQEHERLRVALAAYVAAAPVRPAIESVLLSTGTYGIRLECGHTAFYFKPRDSMHCHECVGQPSPTRRP